MSLPSESGDRDLWQRLEPISTPESKKLFFHCPFEPQFHAQSRYQGVALDKVTDCSTFPLTSIKRLKNHIFESHVIKACYHNCHRCNELFSSEEALEQH